MFSSSITIGVWSGCVGLYTSTVAVKKTVQPHFKAPAVMLVLGAVESERVATEHIIVHYYLHPVVRLLYCATNIYRNLALRVPGEEPPFTSSLPGTT